jgi:hypothetical protein
MLVVDSTPGGARATMSIVRGDVRIVKPADAKDALLSAEEFDV